MKLPCNFADSPCFWIDYQTCEKCALNHCHINLREDTVVSISVLVIKVIFDILEISFSKPRQIVQNDFIKSV